MGRDKIHGHSLLKDAIQSPNHQDGPPARARRPAVTHDTFTPALGGFCPDTDKPVRKVEVFDT